MIHLGRLFSTEGWKGTRNYLNTQRSYELVRTILYFGISGALFAVGWLSTGSRNNLLTIVAILGCLPASKSLVGFIMFCRYQSLSQEKAEEIARHVGALEQLYDLVFTGHDANFLVGHMVIKGNTVCGFSDQKDFLESSFEKHLTPLLKADSLVDVNIKIFTDLSKYLARLDQMRELSCDDKNTGAIINTLKSVSL